MGALSRTLFVIFAAILLAIFIFGGFSDISYAAESNVTVDVNISILSEITVNPFSINWTQITPGQAGGIRNLTIHNTGSVNVTNVYALITTLDNETTRPYTSSLAFSYSAGGVLLFHNETDPRFYWAGRIEWNWTESIANFVDPFTSLGGSDAYGFFRNASKSYIWAITNGTNGTCNNTGAQLALTDPADDGTQFTRAPTTGSINRDGGDANFSYFSVNRATNFLYQECVAVDRNCAKIYAYKYDRRTSSIYFNNTFDICANAQNIISNMVPSQTEKITADVYMPKGMPAGDMKQATWVFRAY
ncbi:MAG: hypothetical protein NT120_01410 [Candidatus Aenigmarchaeota archaeon]|nr:hypothetical protein [Candidatus Aenigmarchaeota archaeon]